MSPLYDQLLIREAGIADSGAVRDIRNDAVEHTTAVWTTAKQTPEEAVVWWAEYVGRGAAFVAVLGDEVVGYACWAPWREKEGYRYTLEDSVYVSSAHHGRGIGRALLTTLLDAARASGAHVMLADIESSNVASIALHASLGFETAGTLREIGTKFGRWLDLTIMRCEL